MNIVRGRGGKRTLPSALRNDERIEARRIKKKNMTKDTQLFAGTVYIHVAATIAIDADMYETAN